MNFLSPFWFHYEWPSLQGNGPEDITSLIVIGIITSIFVPRVRRWWIAREQHIHAKLDHVLKTQAHIIRHHPDIPTASTTTGDDLSKVPEHLKGRP